MHVGTVSEIWRFPVKSMSGEPMESCTVNANGVELDRTWAVRDVEKGECRGAKQWPVLLQCKAVYRGARDDTAYGGSKNAIRHVDITFPDGSGTASDAPDINERLSTLLGKPVTFEALRPASDHEFYRRAAPGSALLGRLGRSKTMVRGIQALMRVAKLDGELREDFSREDGEPLPDLSSLPPEVLEFTSPLGTFFDAYPIHVLTTASLREMKRVQPDAAWDSRRFRPNFLIETSPELTGLVESHWSGRILRVGDLRLRCTIPTMRCGMTMHAQGDLPREPAILRSIVREADQNLGVYASVESPGSVRPGDAVTLE